MSTSLYMLRHGDAGAHFASGDDSQRPLTLEGIEKLKIQAQFLKAGGVKIDEILTSPYLRARQTAELIAETYNLKVTEDPLLASGVFSTVNLQTLLNKRTDVKHLLIAGHEPDFGIVLSQILGGTNVEFKKGAVARVKITSLKPVRGTLHWFLTPELMGARDKDKEKTKE